MQTILDILNKTTQFFQKNGVPDAKLDAQYILAHGLGMKRMDLYLNFDRPLQESELAVLRPLVARRAKREPLQHIVGNTCFRGHEICCDARALIPRPETEMLVDLLQKSLPAEYAQANSSENSSSKFSVNVAKDSLSETSTNSAASPITNISTESSADSKNDAAEHFSSIQNIADAETTADLVNHETAKETNAAPIRVADIGTGSGVIAISIAKEFKNVQVFASDISSAALELALKNAKQNECDDKIRFYEGDLLSALPAEAFPLHALVANLPYIPDEDKESLQAEVRFDPESALFGGSDGLDFIRRLLREAEGKMLPDAPIILEIASGQETLLEKETQQNSAIQFVRSVKDYYGNVRFVEFKVV